MSDRLYRSRDDRMLAGVAGGVAEMVDADPSLIRIVWAVLIVLTGGLALLVYIVMAIVVPEAPEGHVPHGAAYIGSQPAGATDGSGAPPADPGAGPVAPGGWVAPDGSVVPMASGASAGQEGRQRHRRGDRNGGVIAGVILILIGGAFLIRQFVPSIDLGMWWPVAAIIVGILLVVMAVLPSGRRSA